MRYGIYCTVGAFEPPTHHATNNRLVTRLESERALHEGQAGFREKRSCVDNIFTLNEIVQSKMREGKHGLGTWVRGRMWRGIQNMYGITQSAVSLEGEISEPFNIGQGWHRVVVCRLSSFFYYFYYYFY